MHKATVACCWGLTVIVAFAGYQLRGAARTMKEQREAVRVLRVRLAESEARAGGAVDMLRACYVVADECRSQLSKLPVRP